MEMPKYWDEKQAKLLLLHANGGIEAWHDVTDDFPMEPPSADKRLWLVHSHIPVNWPSFMCSMEWYTVEEVQEHIRPMLEGYYWKIEKDNLRGAGSVTTVVHDGP